MADRCIDIIKRAVMNKHGVEMKDFEVHEVLMELVELGLRERDMNFVNNASRILSGKVSQDGAPIMDFRNMSHLDKYKFYEAIQAETMRKELSHVADSINTTTSVQNGLAAIMQMLDTGLYPGYTEGLFHGKKRDVTQAMKAILMGDMSGLPFSKHSAAGYRGGMERAGQAYVNKLLAQDRFEPIRTAFKQAAMPGYGRMKGYPEVLKRFSQDVIDELKGIGDYKVDKGVANTKTGNKLAKEFADALRLTADTQLHMMRSFGLQLPMKKGFMPNALDAMKIRKMAKGDFVNMMLGDKIDWENSFPGVRLEKKMSPQWQKEAIEEIWDGYSARGERPRNGFRVTGDVHGRQIDAQQIVFKDGASWMDVHSKIGKNDNIISVFDYRNQMNARMFSMTRMFGTNPEAGFDTMRRELIDMLERGIISSPNKEKDLARLKAANLFYDFEAKKVYDSNGKLLHEEPQIRGGRRAVNERPEELIGTKYGRFKDQVHAFLRSPTDPAWLRKAGEGLGNMYDDFKRTAGELLLPADGGLRMAFAEVAGETLHPVVPEATKIWSNIRQLKNMAVLGKVLLSSVTDHGNAAFSLVQKGASWHEAFNLLNHEIFNNRFSQLAERQAIAHGFAAFYDDLIGSMHGRFSFMEQGGIARMQETFFRVSGLQAWTDMMRASTARANMRWLGQQAHLPFDRLPHGTKMTLQSHGFNEHWWDFVRKNGIEEINGQRYLLPDKFDLNTHDWMGGYSVPDREIMQYANNVKNMRGQYVDVNAPKRLLEALDRQAELLDNPQRTRAQINLDVWKLINDETKHGVIEVDDRIRYYMLRGTRPGTMSGEILRFMAMFKTFPLGVADRILNRGASFAPGQGSFDAFKPLAQYIAVTTAFGYMAMSMSDIASGYTPRVPSDFSSTLSTLQAAVVKGGGMGLYGDLMISAMDGNTNRFLSSVFGPVLGGTVPDALGVMREMITMGDQTGAKMFRFALNNTPYANFIGFRAVMDATINREIYELLDPGRSARVRWFNEEKLGRYEILPH